MNHSEFFTEGRNGALVHVEIEAFNNGRMGVFASAERLSRAAFARMLRQEFPGVRFTIENNGREHRAVERKTK